MRKILILGCNSFLGINFLNSIIKESNWDNSYTVSLFGKSLSPFITSLPNYSGKLKYIQGDFTNADDLVKALAGQDIVYHFISETFPHTSWNDVKLEVDKNLSPTINFLEEAIAAGVKKVVYISSGGTVYGTQKGRLNELTSTAPFSPYGIFKLCIENLLRYHQTKNHLNYDVYRISNVYGPYQNINKGLGFINTCLSNIKNSKETIVFGDGSNVRDYIYSEDVANLLKLSLFKSVNDSGIYHISTNKGLSISDLLAIFQKKFNYTNVKFEEARKSDNKYVVLDNTKILNWFAGYKFKNIEDGIENTYHFIMNPENYNKR